MPLCDYVRLLQLYANRLLIASFGTMEEVVVSPKKSVNGCCAFSDECKCRMFRCPVASEPYKCFCTHDISQHEMIGVMDGAEVRYFWTALKKRLFLGMTPININISKDYFLAKTNFIRVHKMKLN